MVLYTICLFVLSDELWLPWSIPHGTSHDQSLAWVHSPLPLHLPLLCTCLCRFGMCFCLGGHLWLDAQNVAEVQTFYSTFLGMLKLTMTAAKIKKLLLSNILLRYIQWRNRLFVAGIFPLSIYTVTSQPTMEWITVLRRLEPDFGIEIVQVRRSWETKRPEIFPWNICKLAMWSLRYYQPMYPTLMGGSTGPAQNNSLLFQPRWVIIYLMRCPDKSSSITIFFMQDRAPPP